MTTKSAMILNRVSAVAGSAGAVIGAIALAGHAVGSLPVSASGAPPPTSWASFSALLIGLALVALARRPDSRPVRTVIVAATSLILITSLISLATHLSSGPAKAILQVLSTTRPLGGVTLLLASASLLATAIGRSTVLAGLLGLAVTGLGFVVCLGFIYGGPLLMGRDVAPVSPVSAVAALLIGAGLITAGGPQAWPNRLFTGESIAAMLLRWLVPLVALAVIVTDLATIDLFSHFSRALGSALNTAISVAVSLFVVSYLGRVIGGRLERANAAARESEQRFTRVFKSVPAGLAISRLSDGRFIEVNDAFGRIFGYSRDELVGRRSIDLRMWTDNAEREAYLRRVQAKGGAARGEIHLRAKGGRMVVVQSSGQVVEFQDQEALLSSFIDVTEQRQAEDALSVTERKFSTIFRESPVALTVSEFDSGRFVEANAAYLEHIGASSVTQILGRSAVELGLLRPEDRERYITGPIRDGRTKGLIVPMRNLRGESRTSEMALSTYEVDGKRFILTSTIDVTERLRAEREARTELAERRRVQRRLDLSLQAGGIGAWELDLETRRFQADETLTEIYGIARSGEGMDWRTWAERVHEDDLALVSEQLARIEAGLPEAFADFRVVRPDGSTRYVHGAAALLPADDERPARIVGVNIDVTSQKLTELELRKHQEGLEALVTTRTAELRAAKDAAESASRAKGAFLAHMSHEIRTPMNAILGYAQLLQVDGSLDAAQRRKVTAIHTSGDHLLGLLNDILEMSRIEAGRQTLSVQPFDLPALLNTVQSMFTELTSQRGLQFHVEIAPDLVRGVQSDPGKVRQVLINLLGNATKFTDRGGIVVRVTSHDVVPDQCQVTIAVEDTGPGIPADEQELIFTAFGQAEAGRQKSGTGLGLTISRSVARLLGGDLTVRSTVGQGSTFTFTFTGVRVPDTALGDSSRRHGPQHLDPAETRRKALVVDDVPSNRELLEESLSRAGFETRGAVSGEEALEVHREWAPDLVLMDLHMPGMGGLAAIRYLREAKTPAAIVVTTAGADNSTETTVIAAGAVGLLRKPYRESELFETIARGASIKFVEARAAESALVDASAPRLDVLVRDIPPELVAELRAACRQARAARLVQLADRVAPHSRAAADAIRELANGFRYRALLEALEGAHG